MLGALPDVGRVHLYRWGDGGAHFHVWLLPRPLGMLDAMGHYLPLWEDVLPTSPTTSAARPSRRSPPRCDRPSTRPTLARRLRHAGRRGHRPGLDDRRGGVRGFGPAARRGRLGAAGRARRRRGRGLVQRHVVGPAGGAVPVVRRHLRLRPPAAGRVAGATSPAGGSSSARPRRCAAMALTFATYAVPADRWARLVAAAAVVALTAVNLRGHHPHRPADPGAGRDRARSCWRGRRRGGRAGDRHRAAGLRLPTAVGVRRPPGGRPAVLRLRRLRPHRHAGRGGASTPERTIPRAIAGRAGWRCVVYAVVAVVAAGRRWAGRARAHRHPAGPGRVAGRRGLGLAGRARGRGGRQPRLAAGPARGRRPHRAGHGPRAATCPGRWPPSTRGTRSPTGSELLLAAVVVRRWCSPPTCAA